MRGLESNTQKKNLKNPLDIWSLNNAWEKFGKEEEKKMLWATTINVHFRVKVFFSLGVS